MSPTDSDFGQLLRGWRIAAGLTQEELSGRAGISVDAIRRLESGTRLAPRRETVALLTSALGLGDNDSRRFRAAAERARRRGPSASGAIDEGAIRSMTNAATKTRAAVNGHPLSEALTVRTWGLPFSLRHALLTLAILAVSAGLFVTIMLSALARLRPEQSSKVVQAPTQENGSDAALLAITPGLRIAGASQCTSDWSEQVTNNTHGTVSVVSGTRSFVGLSLTHKEINASAGEMLNGKVLVVAHNGGASFAMAPFVYTPTWGPPESSWRLIARWVPDGTRIYSPEVSLRVPASPGAYHVIFAFQLELTGADVASATNWSRHHDVWRDGDDLAELRVKQISDAQRFGCTIAKWLMPDGYEDFSVPADALTIRVRYP